MFECKDSDVMIVKLYTILVRPIIEYNNILWGPFYILDNQKFKRIQHKANRIIPSTSHLPYHDIEFEALKFIIFTTLLSKGSSICIKFSRTLIL